MPLQLNVLYGLMHSQNHGNKQPKTCPCERRVQFTPRSRGKITPRTETTPRKRLCGFW